MAIRLADTVRRLAVEHARARMPGSAPESVQVVELQRDRVFAVLRMAPDGVLVLDDRGRLVRGHDRLAAVGRHVRALEQVQAALAESQIQQRHEHALRDLTLLQSVGRELGESRLRELLRRLVTELGSFSGRLEAVRDEQDRRTPATQRTLQRTVTLLNEAARADRAVVRTTRRLGAVLATARSKTPASAVLERWVAARLGSRDLPFFHPEFDEVDGARFVSEFVKAARS